LNKAFRFGSVGQVRQIVQRLGRDNLIEAPARLAGEFLGVLPNIDLDLHYAQGECAITLPSRCPPSCGLTARVGARLACRRWFGPSVVKSRVLKYNGKRVVNARLIPQALSETVFREL
jgi:hypothetical protein